jgi:NAD(P)-dependent dehydrogenase (short-subunit alcohol dehydrogenase family)
VVQRAAALAGREQAMKPMEGKTALVTGASSGIGLAVARRFVDDGATVYVTARRGSELSAAAAHLGVQAVPVTCDVSSASDLDRMMDTIGGDGRRLDAVVANAGLGAGTALAEATEAQFRHVFGVNAWGTLLTVQKSLPLLTGDASVILVGSTSAYQGPPGMGLYAASKAAVRSLARTWAAELAPRGVRVNVLTPGPTATAAITRLAARSGRSAEDYQASLAALTPLGRIGRPEEIAAVAAFLAAPDSSFVTGAEFTADGGQIQV